jgi:glycosyltransferase involved in cell wall biosynthesis
MPKVAFFIPKLDKGGPDRVFFELCIGLKSNGLEVVLIVEESGGYYWDKLPFWVPKFAIDDRSCRRVRYPVKQFGIVLGQVRPDVILCTLGSIITACLSKVITFSRVPLVIRPANHLTWNSFYLFKRNPLKHSFSWVINVSCLFIADHLICQSFDLLRDFRRYGLRKAKLSIIANPIDVVVERTPDVLDNGKKAVINLLAVGRLDFQKGFDILIDSFAIVQRKNKDIRLTIVGEGDERELLERKIANHKLENWVVLTGYVEDVTPFFRSADFTICSSRTEAFPNVILESLSFGTPVISTRCSSSIDKMIIDGATGWQCSKGKSKAMAHAIENAISSPRLSKQVIKNFVKENFSTSKITCQYARLFLEIINRDNTNRK